MNFSTMTTPQLKEWITKTDQELVAAVTELCTRHDAGDLIEFFNTLQWGPPPELAKEIMKTLHEIHVPDAVTAAVVGKSANAIEKARNRMSEKSGTATPDAVPDKPGTYSLERRRQKQRSDKVDWAEAEQMVRNGKTWVDIAEHFGVSEGTIRNDQSLRDLRAAVDPSFGQPLQVDWAEAEQMVRNGKTFVDIAEHFGVSEGAIRTDQGVRNARGETNARFEPAADGVTVRHHERSVACEVEPFNVIYKEIDGLLERVVRLYTLSSRDKRRLITMLSEYITEIDKK